MPQHQTFNMTELFRAAAGYPAKPRVFVSYHHGNDQEWYNTFESTFCDTYKIFTDRSVNRKIDSSNTEYVMRTIRENYITGSSITVVLCGTQTWQRKYVDWEIKATLDKQHALLGIILPSNHDNFVPQRLYDNLNSGYAHCIHWPKTLQELDEGIRNSKSRAEVSQLINNSRDMMSRNFS